MLQYILQGIKNKIFMMFFGDPDTVEKNLHNDLNTIIKNIKIRQDQYIELLEYNRNFISLHKQFDANVFINDELIKHKFFLSKIKGEDTQLRHEQDHIMSKYQFVNIQADSIHKLMSRVGARILELFQASLQKVKALTIGCEQRHKKMKMAMLKFLNQNEKIDIPGILTLIITYANEKIFQQIGKLEELIRILEQGQPQKVHSMLQIKAVQADRTSPPAITKRQPSLDLKRQKQKLKQKIEKLKEQAKQNEKIKKQKNKVAQKMLTNMHSTMDISKNQFMEDVVTLNPKEKYKKLYDEIFIRNKFNREQIIAFEAKSQEFQKKVRQFKAIMKAQSQRIQQAVIIKKFRKKTQNQHFPISNQDPETYNSTPQQIKYVSTPSQDDNNQKFFSQQKPVIFPQVQFGHMKFTQSRTKVQGQKGQSPRITKETTNFCPIQSTQQVVFQHLKFDDKQQQVYTRTNRARLPQIGGRVSMQANFSSSKKKVKNEQKISIVVPVDINNQIERPAFANFRIQNIKQKQRGVSTQNKDKQKDPSIPKPMQYTFYIKKRTNKFYETKNHFIM